MFKVLFITSIVLIFSGIALFVYDNYLYEEALTAVAKSDDFYMVVVPSDSFSIVDYWAHFLISGSFLFILIRVKNVISK